MIQTKKSKNRSPLMTEMPLLPFTLSPEQHASEPPEARGLARDQVRLLVSNYLTDEVEHTRFRQLPDFLQQGDVLVVNTSGTLNAALPALRSDDQLFELHLSTRLPNSEWVIELRQLREDGAATDPFFDVVPGEQYGLPAEGLLEIIGPYRPNRIGTLPQRLWRGRLRLTLPFQEYLERHGYPIRYSYVRQAWPISYYQTVFATEPGSAEMPSAGRGFTPELVTALVAKGVQFAPILLHTGVASLEAHEPPYAEFYEVPATSAEIINQARVAGRRVIGIGTTAVRALETAADENGQVYASTGWTELVITPQRGLYAIDGMLTGFHEPEATHLAMLGALAPLSHLARTYDVALSNGYLWHEFGDLHLIVP